MSNMLRALTTFLQKKILLSFILLATVVALFYPQNTFAAYENYKTLFTKTSGITLFSGTGQNSWAVTDASYAQGITGFRFNINLEFGPFGSDSNPITDAQMGEKWNYISNIGLTGSNRVFIVRICEVTTTGALNEDSCYIKEVPFTEYGVMDKDKKIVGVSQNVPGAGELVQKLILTPLQNPSFASGTYPYPGIFEKVWDPTGRPENPWMRSITIPFNTTGSDGNWYWFKKNTRGTFVRESPPRFPFTTKNLRADFWYCAGPANTEDGTKAPEEGDIVKRFPGLCDGTSYFRIGNPIDITLPTSLQEIGRQDVANNELSNTDTKLSVGARNSNLPECSVTGGYFGGGTLMGCAAQIIFYLIFRPIAWFANIVGMLFDFFVGFSINDEAYRLEFIQNGWQVVRDFANIFFIIIMVYAGFSVALGFGKYSIKNVVGTLIINALIINFSLFITRLGVDMSNIFARVFYNQMTVDTTETALGGYKPISVALISAFNPQKLMDANILTQSAPQAPKTEEEGSQGDVNFNADGDALTQKSMDIDSSEYAAFFAIVSLSSALILFFVAKMFFSVAFIFIGRVVSLYVAMIFSPLAFLTKGDVPILGKISKINWNDWFSNYQKDLYLPPIFMFFLYIIGFLMSAGFATTLKLDAGTSYLEIFVSVAIPMVIVYLLISKAKGVAEKYSSEAAKAVTEKLEGVGKVAAGAALGVATGGLAVAGRNIIGRAGEKLASSQRLKETMSKGGFMGKLASKTLQTGDSLSKATYDARNTGAYTKYMGDFGKPNSKLGGFLGTNQKNTEGGFRGAIDRKIKSETDYANRMLMSKEEAAEADALRKAWEKKYAEARAIQETADRNNGVVFDEVAFRERAVAAEEPPETSAEINIRRENNNNKRLQRASFVSRVARIPNRATVPAGALGVAGTAASIGGGLATVATATLVGQASITSRAQQQVAQSRASNAKPAMDATQRGKLEAKITQLQTELNKRISTLNQIGSTFTPALTYDKITPADIIDYQNNEQATIDTLQSNIDGAQMFIDQNKNSRDANVIRQVNTARASVRSDQNLQSVARNKKNQAATIFSEFNRIDNDIKNTRTQLGQ